LEDHERRTVDALAVEVPDQDVRQLQVPVTGSEAQSILDLERDDDGRVGGKEFIRGGPPAVDHPGRITAAFAAEGVRQHDLAALRTLRFAGHVKSVAASVDPR